MTTKDVVTLERSDNSSCKIHVFGATLYSWINKGEEMIFVSSKSHFDKKKAIRGGIPIVFPNFGPWDLGPQHGFARIMSWNSTEVSKDESSNPMAVFNLSDTEETRKMWNFRHVSWITFQLTYIVTLLEDSLKTDFIVKNVDDKQLGFTCLLHNYFKVPDVTKVTVSGLNGLRYKDKVRGGEMFTENGELVTVSENIDRIYQDTPSEHILKQVAGGCSIVITKTELPDTVVWNPWKENAASMSDFGDDEYPQMLCVEAGFVAKQKVLASDEKYMGSQRLTVKQVV
ncbi:hypothetical protein LSH36_163g02039 [Paralvinella palmiformis]|uniref:glucose-6-phosphate 1-epimerase n=1 Tax=Paralvinella palmiformis TaxID=53620 RepID=A0AAD9JV45_9ANNE|nr:hypothetical protein LSH36_163g02039 [Paralvinella palmiformis]